MPWINHLPGPTAAGAGHAGGHRWCVRDKCWVLDLSPSCLRGVSGHRKGVSVRSVVLILVQLVAGLVPASRRGIAAQKWDPVRWVRGSCAVGAARESTVGHTCATQLPFLSCGHFPSLLCCCLADAQSKVEERQKLTINSWPPWFSFSPGLQQSRHGGL